jgi:uncharacterized protein (DUF488 family)
MNTSFFAKYRGDKGCNIALYPVKGFRGISYPDLYPSWYYVMEYKKTGNKEAYIKEYYTEVLNKLDPQKVYDELNDYTLLCYEKSGDFCHRRVVADWIERSLGINVPEIIYPMRKKSDKTKSNK